MPNLKRGDISHKLKAKKKRQRKLFNILIFITVWLISILVIGIVVACFANYGLTHPLLVVALIFIPIALAIFSILPAKEKHAKPKTIHQMRTTVSTSVYADNHSADMHTMYCTHCGMRLMPDMRFCSNCGYKTNNTPTAEQSPLIADNSRNNDTKQVDNTKTYRVTGIEHYKDSILNLALENDDYTKTKRELVDDLLTEERIWKYSFYPSKVELVPEPNNIYDPYAIKVIVDSEHVGYIKKGSCKHLLKVIAEGRLGDVDCTIGGGPYKYIYEDYDDSGNEKYEMEQEEINFTVVLHIVERKV